MSHEWQDEAACTSTDPELFFTPTLEKYAKQVCAGCPVAKQCLQYALEGNLDSGVYGGLSEAERKQMRKASARSRAGIPNKKH